MRTLLILTLAAAFLQSGRPPAQPPPAPPDNAALREQGRHIFASQCGKCHDEDGRKKLADGSTLLGRLSASKDSHALLGTRLKRMTTEDSRAVSLYVDGLLSQFRSEKKE